VSAAGERPQPSKLTPTSWVGKAASLPLFCELNSSASSQGKGTGPDSVVSCGAGLCSAIPAARAAFLCQCLKVASCCHLQNVFGIISSKLTSLLCLSTTYQLTQPPEYKNAL